MRITSNVKHERRDWEVGRTKAPNNKIGRRLRPCVATLYQKVDFFAILGPRSHPRSPVGVKFCTAKRTHVPLRLAKFHINRCNESPLRGENADFWPLSKTNTGSLPLPGNPAGKNKCIIDRLC